jgi:hypothetical protein
MSAETIDQICNRHTADKGSQWHNFCVRYAPHLEPMRDMTINLLEVGIQFGCSARFWLEAFPRAQIYGVDTCLGHQLNDPRFHFTIGDQRSREFWAQWKSSNPIMRVIIDDAEHRADASKAMFESLWPHLEPGGIYAIEDVGTWWDSDFSSPIVGDEWLRFLCGEVNWHGKDYGGKPHPKPYELNDLEKTLDSIHLSKHLVILVKK